MTVRSGSTVTGKSYSATGRGGDGISLALLNSRKSASAPGNVLPIAQLNPSAKHEPTTSARLRMVCVNAKSKGARNSGERLRYAGCLTSCIARLRLVGCRNALADFCKNLARCAATSARTLGSRRANPQRRGAASYAACPKGERAAELFDRLLGKRRAAVTSGRHGSRHAAR